MSDVTRILSAIEQGDAQASKQLLPLVYEELRNSLPSRWPRKRRGKRYRRQLWFTKPISGWWTRSKVQSWNSRGHFFAAAAEAMRRILIERARHKSSAKGGGQLQRLDLREIELPIVERQLDLLALDEALEELEKADRRAAAVVKLRYFTGLTTAEAANALGVSLATAENDWAYAKSYLRLRLSDAHSRSGSDSRT